MRIVNAGNLIEDDDIAPLPGFRNLPVVGFVIRHLTHQSPQRVDPTLDLLEIQIHILVGHVLLCVLPKAYLIHAQAQGGVQNLS